MASDRACCRAKRGSTGCARVGQVLERLRALHSAGEVAVVTHGGVLVTTCELLLGLPSARPTPFRFSNASLSIFEFADGQRALRRLNDVCHLEKSEVRIQKSEEKGAAPTSEQSPGTLSPSSLF